VHRTVPRRRHTPFTVPITLSVFVVRHTCGRCSKAPSISAGRRGPRRIQSLALEYDQVKVTQHGNVTETCVAQCWGAKRRTWPDCTCACLGENHGSGSPLDHVVSDGNLSVRHAPTERTFWVTAGEALT
jgi:hypothetical protein